MQACDWTMDPWPNGHNATNTSWCANFFVSFMIYDMTKMCFVVSSVYSSKNSLMSSLSSLVKTTSQQFRSVCLSAIFGISHDMYIHAIFLDIPFLLLLAHSVLWDQFIALGYTLIALYYFLLHESWQVLQGILSESVLLQWFSNL